MNPVFLTIAEVLDIHGDQIWRYGGDPSIRDMGLLESALAMPSAGFGDDYLHRDVFEMAAAYLFHIIQNHPFVDGNKRTGLASAVVFLYTNDVEVDADEDELESIARGVATGHLDKAIVAAYLRDHSSAVS